MTYLSAKSTTLTPGGIEKSPCLPTCKMIPPLVSIRASDIKAPAAGLISNLHLKTRCSGKGTRFELVCARAGIKQNNSQVDSARLREAGRSRKQTFVTCQSPN